MQIDERIRVLIILRRRFPFWNRTILKSLCDCPGAASGT